MRTLGGILKKFVMPLAVLALASMMAGCSEVEPVIEKDVSYTSIGDLRDAYMAAGYDCEDEARPSKLGGGQGEVWFCTGHSSIYLFNSVEDRKEHMERAYPSGASPRDRAFLVHDRWEIENDRNNEVEAAHKKMGGEIIIVPGNQLKPEPTEVAEAPGSGGQYAALESLRVSYGESGVDCPADAFDPSELVNGNALIGQCANDSALLLFEEEGEGEAWMENNFETNPQPFLRGYIDGGKWFIMGPDDPDAIIASMGGELKTVEAVEQ